VIASGVVVATALRTRQLGRRGYYSWLLIAIVLFYLSADEMTQLHELLGGDDSIGRSLNRRLGLDFITFDWVIPAALAVLIGLPLLVPWFLRLPRGTLALFVLAGAIWLGGAFGMESYAGDYIKTRSIDSWGYHVLSATEETLEMLGLITFIASLLVYFKGYLQDAPEVRRAGVFQGAPRADQSGAAEQPAG